VALVCLDQALSDPTGSVVARRLDFGVMPVGVHTAHRTSDLADCSPVGIAIREVDIVAAVVPAVEVVAAVPVVAAGWGVSSAAVVPTVEVACPADSDSNAEDSFVA
jgi:hypothetical protein